MKQLEKLRWLVFWWSVLCTAFLFFEATWPGTSLPHMQNDLLFAGLNALNACGQWFTRPKKKEIGQ